MERDTHLLPIHHHSDAQNIIFRGNGVNMKAENLPGTRLVTNSLPTGTNQTIGTFYDSVNNRIFYSSSNSSSFILLPFCMYILASSPPVSETGRQFPSFGKFAAKPSS